MADASLFIPIFERALEFLTHSVPSERALVLYDCGDGLEVVGAYGADPETVFSSAPFSLSLMHGCINEGRPVLSVDVQNDPNVKSIWSLRVSEIRSVVCVPFRDQDARLCGLLYADARGVVGAFQDQHLDSVTRFARVLEKEIVAAIESKVKVTALAPRPLGLYKLPPPPRPAEARTSDPEPAVHKVLIRPTGRAVALFFRSLATLMQAGVPINRALHLLGEGGEDPRMDAISLGLSKRVAKGHSLSSSLIAYPKAFSPFHCRLVEVGEISGSMVKILEQLAIYEEHCRKNVHKVRAALAYPAVLLTICCSLLVFGVPYLLRGQFRFIHESGVKPPFISEVVMAMAQLPTKPVCWILAALLVGAIWYASKLPAVRRRVAIDSLRIPVLGRAIRLVAVARFARCLEVQVRTGVGLLEAIPPSLMTAGHPCLCEKVKEVRDQVMGGNDLAQALRITGFFPRDFLECVSAGEVTGRLPHLLNWVAEMYEVQLDASLAAITGALEPIIMLVMGAVVGVLMLATMLPMIQVLETL